MLTGQAPVARTGQLCACNAHALADQNVFMMLSSESTTPFTCNMRLSYGRGKHKPQ